MAILYLNVIYNSNNNTVLHLLGSESAAIDTTLLRLKNRLATYWQCSFRLHRLPAATLQTLATQVFNNYNRRKALSVRKISIKLFAGCSSCRSGKNVNKGRHSRRPSVTIMLTRTGLDTWTIHACAVSHVFSRFCLHGMTLAKLCEG